MSQFSQFLNATQYLLDNITLEIDDLLSDLNGILEAFAPEEFDPMETIIPDDESAIIFAHYSRIFDSMETLIGYDTFEPIYPLHSSIYFNSSTTLVAEY